MSIKFFLITSRQGKLRLSKWFTNNLSTSTTNTAISSGDSSTSAGNSASQKEKAKIIKDVTTAVLNRKTRMCNVVEYKDFKVIYRRYASLYFIAGCEPDCNELIILEQIHRLVEIYDKWFVNVCELDIIFGFQAAYTMVDEVFLGGEMVETSNRSVLHAIRSIQDIEDSEEAAEAAGGGFFGGASGSLSSTGMRNGGASSYGW